jgi:hypothetical protein
MTNIILILFLFHNFNSLSHFLVITITFTINTLSMWIVIKNYILIANNCKASVKILPFVKVPQDLCFFLFINSFISLSLSLAHTMRNTQKQFLVPSFKQLWIKHHRMNGTENRELKRFVRQKKWKWFSCKERARRKREINKNKRKCK